MWSRTYSKRVKGLNVDKIWKIWTDVDQWKDWQDDVEYSKMQSAFETGGKFLFKPKGGPNLTLELTEVTDLKSFTDLTKFPLAKMYDTHEILVHEDEIELKCTTSIEGPLAFVWRKLVAEEVFKGIPHQIEALLARATEMQSKKTK